VSWGVETEINKGRKDVGNSEINEKSLLRIGSRLGTHPKDHRNF